MLPENPPTDAVISLEQQEVDRVCPKCYGNGLRHDSDEELCPDCNGSGDNTHN